MGVHIEARARRRQAVAAISGACLAVMSAGCSGSFKSTAPPAVAVSAASVRATPRTVPPAATPAPSATAGAATVPAATTALPEATAPVDTRIKVYGNCTTPSVEPAEIVLACADYGALLEGLRWTSWTAANATAVGTLVYNDCTPSCAQGHHHDVRGTRVVLTVPVHGVGGQVVWSRIQENPEPPGYETGPLHGAPQPLPIRPD